MCASARTGKSCFDDDHHGEFEENLYKIQNRRSSRVKAVRQRTNIENMKMEVLLVNQFQREFGSPKLGVQGECCRPIKSLMMKKKLEIFHPSIQLEGFLDYRSIPIISVHGPRNSATKCRSSLSLHARPPLVKVLINYLIPPQLLSVLERKSFPAQAKVGVLQGKLF